MIFLVLNALKSFPDSMTLLLSIFVKRTDLKQQVEKEMIKFSVGKMVVHRKLIHSPIFVTICQSVKKMFVGTLSPIILN